MIMHTKTEKEDIGKINPGRRRNGKQEEEKTGIEDVERLSRPQTSQNP